MSTDFTVDPDGIGQAAKALDEEGHAFNDIRNAVPAGSADAGASTTILTLVVGHLFTGATALLEDRANTVSTMTDCRDTYLRTEDAATCELEGIMHTTPDPTPWSMSPSAPWTMPWSTPWASPTRRVDTTD